MTPIPILVMVSQQNSSTTYMYMNVEFENENPCLKKKIIDFFDSLRNLKKQTKQEAHWPHLSPEKQLQSINTFVQSNDYT